MGRKKARKLELLAAIKAGKPVTVKKGKFNYKATFYNTQVTFPKTLFSPRDGFSENAKYELTSQDEWSDAGGIGQLFNTSDELFEEMESVAPLDEWQIGALS